MQGTEVRGNRKIVITGLPDMIPERIEQVEEVQDNIRNGTAAFVPDL